VPLTARKRHAKLVKVVVVVVVNQHSQRNESPLLANNCSVTVIGQQFKSKSQPAPLQQQQQQQQH